MFLPETTRLLLLFLCAGFLPITQSIIPSKVNRFAENLDNPPNLNGILMLSILQIRQDFFVMLELSGQLADP
jgi:hypothetical protein